MASEEKTFTCIARNEADSDKLGQALAELLPDGAVVALIGTLGAGKTRLVQAVAAASGVPKSAVSSPTFVLIHEYDEGDRPIYHFDAYRLDDEESFLKLGAEEYFEGFGLSFIEWADKIPHAMPENHIEIQIDILGNSERRFRISVRGNCYNDFLEQIAKKF
ncbi:MAG: tRNA (adenosine(37)-N6)-threonylcarbamoyltransferase complex ATPase subunit type 1 TsaE [Planctomycetaceae bacterium]|jgi:tRNA threonylcarbamoyladenosine biosynthesis protein TsaE|nr:tRNA (adenosine(37)-N6)-threonylcarbamoyltransferase complex ATPase subunit type 1 TsaE [Planctomycetaceae bacterium]